MFHFVRSIAFISAGMFLLTLGLKLFSHGTSPMSQGIAALTPILFVFFLGLAVVAGSGAVALYVAETEKKQQTD